MEKKADVVELQQEVTDLKTRIAELEEDKVSLQQSNAQRRGDKEEVIVVTETSQLEVEDTSLLTYKTPEQSVDKTTTQEHYNAHIREVYEKLTLKTSKYEEEKQKLLEETTQLKDTIAVSE